MCLELIAILLQSQRYAKNSYLKRVWEQMYVIVDVIKKGSIKKVWYDQSAFLRATILQCISHLVSTAATAEETSVKILYVF